MRKKFGTRISDDDLLLRILFRPEQLEGVPMDSILSHEPPDMPRDAESLIAFVRGLSVKPGSRVEVRRGGFSFTAKASARSSTRSTANQH